jgi:hypothetical protein
MNTPQQLETLNHAGALEVLRGNLGSAGSASILWGCIWIVLFGLAMTGAPSLIGAVYLAMGVALVVEGIYVRRSPSANALKAEAVTLAALGVLSLARFTMNTMAASQSHTTGYRGNPLFGLIMLYNAYQSWAAEKVYRAAEESTTPEARATVARILENSKLKTVMTNPNLLEFKSRKMINDNPLWRILFDDGTAYISNWKSGAKKLVSFQAVPQSALMLQVDGERWIGKNVNVRLTANGVPFDQKFEVSPEMLDRAQLFVGMGGGMAASV